MFVRGHIPGAYGIAVDAPLGVWAGWLIPFGTPLVLVTMRPGDLEASVRQLVRIGYDDLRGTLDGGMAAWEAAGLPVERVPMLPAAQLRAQVRAGKAPRILDVRQDDEWADGHLPGAIHVENGRLPSADLPFGKDEAVVVHCHFVNRSTSGISVLARRGYRNLILLDGGYSSWEGSGFEVVRDPGTS
jgi:hydroxyacylglutathione hydrolase